jgi:mannose-6-phosphate isomerase-like protein (cupin superfamily)
VKERRRRSKDRFGSVIDRRTARLERSRPTLRTMPYHVIRPDEFDWITRPHAAGEPARHVVELSDCLGFAHVRGNVWRYEPGAKGRRHRHRHQEETFVVLAGTLSMYLGDPPERVDAPTGAVIRVEPGTPLQSANHGKVDLLLYAYGYPPEDEHAELLEPAV